MREKLIELLDDGHRVAEDICRKTKCDNCPGRGLEDCYSVAEADHLIANGVTIAKWIPVTERLPEECKEVLAYRVTGCEVDSCVSHKKAYWSYDTVSDYPVTHWMPLPEPPKGE